MPKHVRLPRRTPEKMGDPHRGLRFRIYRNPGYEPSNVEARFLCERITALESERDRLLDQLEQTSEAAGDGGQG